MTDPNLTSPEILFVDDEAIAVKYFQRAIGGLATVVTAGSVEEGKKLLDAHADTLTVLVSDQRMPGEFGNELLRYARSNYPHIVRILTTAYSEQEHTIEAINQGQIYRYIKKPWEINELRMELKQAMEFANLRKDHNLLLREKLMVRQKQTIANRIGAIHTLCSSITGPAHFQPAKTYLSAAALATVVPPEPDWVLMDYADLVSAEATRTGEFSYAVSKKLAEMGSQFGEATEDEVVNILVKILDGKARRNDDGTITLLETPLMAEYLETQSNIVVSVEHAAWLAFLLWLDSRTLALDLSRSDPGIQCRVVARETPVSSDWLAAWIEHF